MTSKELNLCVRRSIGLLSHGGVLWVMLTMAFLISALYLTLYLAAVFIKQTEQLVVLALTDGICKKENLRLNYKVREVGNYCLVVRAIQVDHKKS